MYILRLNSAFSHPEGAKYEQTVNKTGIYFVRVRQKSKKVLDIRTNIL